MSQVQLREPPEKVGLYLQEDAKDKNKRWSTFMESDKKELAFFLMQKIFCVG